MDNRQSTGAINEADVSVARWRIRVLWLASLLLAFAGSADPQPESKAGCRNPQSSPVVAEPAPAFQGIEIPIEVHRKFKAVLIKTRIDQKEATLVVDTGSSHTILSHAFLGRTSRPLEHAGTASKGSGFVGEARWAEVTIELGPKIWRGRRVLVMDDFDAISRSFQQDVHGIVGEDLLSEFQVVRIDFKSCKLTLVEGDLNHAK